MTGQRRHIGISLSVVSLAGLLALGFASASILAPSDEVCATATATVAPRTIYVDPDPVYTVPGASDVQTNCVPVPTQTVTVTTTVEPPPPPPPIPPPPPPPPPPPVPPPPPPPPFSSNAGIYPPGDWRPYSPVLSPFNRIVPVFPTLAPNSAGIVNRILTTFSPYIDNMTAGIPRASDFEHPTYWSDPTDPLYTIHCQNPWGQCSIEGRQVRIPNRALAPPTSNDGHLTVAEQWNNDEVDMYDTQTPLSQNGGPLNIGWGGHTDLAGSGIGTGEAVAAEWGNLAGIIRAQEAISGQINHALFLILTCDFGTDASGWVYPATKGGAHCSNQVNAPPMGSHLWLDLTATEIDALPVLSWQKMILKALHNYGAFFGDTGGPGLDIAFESPLTYTSFGRTDPLVAWAAANGWLLYQGYRVGKWDNVPASVWTHLHILDECVARGTC